jgi:hypothetical protein
MDVLLVALFPPRTCRKYGKNMGKYGKNMGKYGKKWTRYFRPTKKNN